MHFLRKTAFLTLLVPFTILQADVEEVIVDASSVKGQSQPIIVHSKTDKKPKTGKNTAA